MQIILFVFFSSSLEEQRVLIRAGAFRIVRLGYHSSTTPIFYLNFFQLSRSRLREVKRWRPLTPLPQWAFSTRTDWTLTQRQKSSMKINPLPLQGRVVQRRPPGMGCPLPKQGSRYEKSRTLLMSCRLWFGSHGDSKTCCSENTRPGHSFSQSCVLCIIIGLWHASQYSTPSILCSENQIKELLWSAVSPSSY